MIIENVNGEARQVFDFSKPDAPAKFHAPVRLGAGYRKQIEIAKAKGMVSDGTMSQVIAIYAKAQKKPNGLDPKAWNEQIQMEAKEALAGGIMENMKSGAAADTDLHVLETLLTPAPGSMSVEKWYKEYSDESEVEEVVNFSEGLVQSKIETVPLKAISGKGTKPKPKAAR